ncbi:MAG: hypothetical protein CM1200mP36_02340 [Gammaproteobacteria bacterium]|nr:MAG: hypothetical protein CM1200mP36_02340 [Gammaproteobacteria bacterium]
MSAGFELNIESRTDLGKGHSRRLRRQGKVPAVLYGGGQNPAPIMLDQTKLLHQMEREAFQTSILTLILGKETQAVVVKDVQRHPAKRRVLHLDFQRIVEDEKITLLVPIHYTGQDDAIGVKEQGGEVAIIVADVEISCLPRDLPEFLELDISELKLNQRMNLSDRGNAGGRRDTRADPRSGTPPSSRSILRDRKRKRGAGARRRRARGIGGGRRRRGAGGRRRQNRHLRRRSDRGIQRLRHGEKPLFPRGRLQAASFV